MMDQNKIAVNTNKYARIEGWLSILVNLLLFGLKYWAGLITGSIALIADAWHTLSDSISSVILIIGFKYWDKPADKDHPFGHGRAELISALIIGMLLIFISYNFAIEAIEILREGKSVNFGMVAIIVTIISVIFKEGLAQYAFWALKKVEFNSLRADAWHHRSDALSSVVILVGIFLNPFFWWIDGVLGIAVALFILHTAYGILSDAINPLLGERPDPELIAKIKKICDTKLDIDTNMHHFHIHNYGNHTELTFHIKLPGTHSLYHAHEIASQIETEIQNKLNIEATIHMEPLN